MKKYLVNLPAGNILLCGEIQAHSWDAARAACDKNGYQLLGEYIEAIDCPEQVEAMIEAQTATVN